MLAEMLLGEMRKVEGLTVAELAAIFGIRQPSLAKLEGSATCRSVLFAGSSRRSPRSPFLSSQA